MGVELVVLDWSGVVSYDFRETWIATNKVFAELGLPAVSMEDRRKRYYADWSRYFVEHGAIDAHAAIRRYNDFMRAGEKPSAIPGAPQAVRECTRVPKFVWSSHPQVELEDDAKRYEVGECFTALHGGINKADPELLSAELKRIGMIPSKVLYVGDTTVDLVLAGKLGMQSVAVVSDFGYQTREHIDACQFQPTHGVVDHVRDVFKILST